jgi:predicted nuclease of predicted toxin-antitoxin system
VKVLLDQDVPRRAAALLRERGVDAVHASEVALGSARDAEVVAWCRAQGAVAVTLDADIHALVALSGLTAPSTIRVRIQGLKGPEMAHLLVDVLERRRDVLEAGALVTVHPGRLRVRRLPIGRTTG